MKKRYIDQFSKTDQTEEEKDKMLHAMMQQHFDGENKQRWAEQLAQQGIRRTPTAFSVWKRSWLAAAAIVLLAMALGVWIWANASNAETLALEMIQTGEPIRLSAAFRGDSMPETTINALALAAYEQKNYPNAIQILQSNPSNGASNRLLLGMCYLYSANYTGAVEVFQSILSEQESAVAEWYLALAYIQAGNTTAAQVLLQKIQRSASSPYSSQAAQMLTSLPTLK